VYQDLNKKKTSSEIRKSKLRYKGKLAEIIEEDFKFSFSNVKIRIKVKTKTEPLRDETGKVIDQILNDEENQ